MLAFVLFGLIYTSCGGQVGIKHIAFGAFLNDTNNVYADSLFTSQTDAAPLETPDLKIAQDNTLYGVSTPSIVSVKVLGDIFGGANLNKKEIIDYTVQPGDTLQGIANAHNISLNTLLWANNLTNSSKLKAGENLTILPVDGVLHIVKSGDSLSAIAGNYKAQPESIVTYNNLSSQNDIYIGDILVVPGGTMPAKPATSKKPTSVANNNQTPVANNFFIYPVEGQISQGLHYYNAIDVRNSCGTPVYAAAAGTVQRAVFNGGYNSGMGNHVTILHSNGTVTYYGHLMSVLVSPGQSVHTGQNIGTVGGAPGMAGAGRSTGCHLHFQVVGAANPLTKYPLGAYIKYK